MSLKSSKKTDTNVYTLEIEIGAEQFKAAVVKAYNKAKGKIALPGFRKGKAPLAMIERFYGKDVFYEDALEIAFPEAVSAAYDEAGIEPVDSPKDVDVKTIGEDGVLFEMKVTVKPEEITVKAYKGLEAEKAEVSVTAEEVDARIEAMRERNARTIAVEDRAAANGDITIIDFEGFVDGKAFEGGKGEKYELELGSGQFIPGFEDQIVGHNLGDSFDVNVKFPEEYGASELAGKDATFKVTLHEIKVKELPELDDEFAKDLDYDTVDELKKGIEEDMLAHKQSDAEKEFEGKLMDALVENVEVEVPEVMYDTQAQENINNFAQRLAQQGIDVDTYLQYMGTDKADFEKTMREQAIPQVKLGLALDKIAEIEKLEVTAEDLEEEFKKLAEMYGMEVEKIKSLIAEDMLKEDLLKEKVVKFVVDNAKALKPGKKAAKKAPAKKTAAKKEDGEAAEKKPAAKKTTTKKAAADKDEAEAEKKPAAKKATAKKTTAKKADGETAEKKPAAKKTTAKKKAEDAE